MRILSTTSGVMSYIKPADARIAIREAGTAERLENVVDDFALVEGVEEIRERARPSRRRRCRAGGR